MKRFLLALLTLIGIAVTLVASQTSPAPREVDAAIRPLSSFGGLQPRISPDGQLLVCSFQGAICRVARTGGEMTRLTDGSGFDIEPVWSADGHRIAYVNSVAAGRGKLRVIDASTGTQVPIPQSVDVSGREMYFKLEFHPDGRRVFGNLRQNGRNYGLASCDLTSGEVTTIVGVQMLARHALSHDGKTIAYATTLDVDGQQSGNDGPQSALWKVASDGGAAQSLGLFPARIYDLCFGGDDKSLIVAADLGEAHNSLWNVALDDPARSARRLTFGQPDEDRPSVSADGRWLAYTDNRAGITSVVVRDMVSDVEQPVAIDRVDFRKPTGVLKLQTVDRESSTPVVARVSLEQEDGKFHAPLGSLYRVLQNYGHFYCERTATLTLPAGKYRLRALRGPEYRAKYLNFEITPGRQVDLSVPLERWTHAAQRGWYSGENHIHANYGYGEWYNTPASMLAQCAGEDLNVCNFMVANSDTDGVFDREFFRGRPDYASTGETILYWNQEFRSTIWGHMTLVNLKQVVEPVFTGFKDTTNPWDIPTNSDIADRTHLQNGLVNYTHVAMNAADPYDRPYSGKSIPIDVALGKIDTIDINYTYEGTVPVWYHFLNCGFHLPASAGTDCFVNRVFSRLPGADRVYVKIDGPLTYEHWIAGLRAGRTFVSNGPVVELKVQDRGPGETIRLAAPGEVHVLAHAESQFGLDAVELVSNGKVVATATLDQGKLQATLDLPVMLTQSGWLGLRASGKGHVDHPLATQYAHTSPIYVDMAGKPQRSREDAEYFLKWIDRIALAVRLRDRVPGDEMKRHVRDQIEQARAVYQQLATAGN